MVVFLDDFECWCFGFVDEVGVEDVEFVVLNYFGRGVVVVVVCLVVFVLFVFYLYVVEVVWFLWLIFVCLERF